MSAPRPQRLSSAQVEVVERLEALDPPNLTALERLIRQTPVGGRGQVDFETTGEVPLREQLRVVVSALTRFAVTDAPAQETRRSLWTPAYLLRGSPGLVDPVVEAMGACHLGPGGIRPLCVRLIGPLDDAMAGWWRRRVRRGGGLRWRRVWAQGQRRDRLPDAVSADAFTQVPRIHRGVRTVLAGSAAEAAAGLAEILGVADVPTPREGIDVAAVDLMRRVNQFTSGSRRLVVPERQPTRLGVPLAFLPWARRRAEALAGDLRVDPDLVVPSSLGALTRAANPAETFDLALRELIERVG